VRFVLWGRRGRRGGAGIDRRAEGERRDEECAAPPHARAPPAAAGPPFAPRQSRVGRGQGLRRQQVLLFDRTAAVGARATWPGASQPRL
jgi:hypothetical protein